MMDAAMLVKQTKNVTLPKRFTSSIKESDCGERNKMTSNPITESEILEVLLGQAAPDVEKRVREAVQSDTETACLYDFWKSTVEATNKEKEQAQAMTERVCQRVLAQTVEAVTSTAGTAWARWPRLDWRVAAAAAACVVVVIASVTIVGLGGDTITKLSENGKGALSGPQEAQSSAVYVAFSKGGDTNSDIRYFVTLESGIAAVSAGGTLKIRGDMGSASTAETPRITKPMRIETVNGSVRIGAI